MSDLADKELQTLLPKMFQPDVFCAGTNDIRSAYICARDAGGPLVVSSSGTNIIKHFFLLTNGKVLVHDLPQKDNLLR